MVENLPGKIKKDSPSGITTENARSLKKAFEEFPCIWLSCFRHNFIMAISKVFKMPRMESATGRHLEQEFS